MRNYAIALLATLLMGATAVAQDIPQDGLLAYYKFDEPDEFFVTDYGPNGLDGEVVGFALWDAGIIGQALLFDGLETYVNCGNDPLFDLPSNEITVMAWVNPFDADNGEHNPWIAKGDHQWGLKHHSSNTPEFFIYDPTQIGPNGHNWHNIQGAALDSATYNGTWAHFAGTYDGNEIKIFKNGILDASVVSSPVFNVTEFEVHLGHNSEATGRYYNGFLDEVLIWEVALSDDQIKAIYDSYSDPSSVEQPNGPEDFALAQNYPNPFNPSTQMSYAIPATAFVTLKVYDILGAEVRTLVDGVQTAGDYSIRFNADGLASGVYFYRLRAGAEFVQTRKMLLMH